MAKLLKSHIIAHNLFFKCAVDADEIRRLGKRFRKLDLDNSGSLSVDEFMSLPELQQNPLVQRVIDIFDQDGNGEVDFKGKPIGYYIYVEIYTHILCFGTEFIQGVSQFSVKGDKESKLRFAFRIYDMDNDGAISNGELFQVNMCLTYFGLTELTFTFLKGFKNDGGKQFKRHSTAANS